MPAIIFLGACAWSTSKCKQQEVATGTSTPPGAKPGSRALILSWVVVPLVFMPAMGVVFGSDLQLQWGTAFLPFVVPAAVEWMPREFCLRVRTPFALKVFLALQGSLLALSHATSPVGLAALKDHHWRTFPSKTFADTLAAPARALLGGPIRVVIGEPAMAGALALRLPERPVVLIDGHFEQSPWVGRGLLRRCGAVQIGHADHLRSGRPIDPAFPDLVWRQLLMQLLMQATSSRSRDKLNHTDHIGHRNTP